MFRGWRVSAGAHSARAPIAAAARSVRDAEAIVRQAWKLELLRQRDRMRFALRIAEHDCDTAREVLATARRDGDPRAIAAAHVAVEQALAIARKSAVACERTAQALRTELNLLAAPALRARLPPRCTVWSETSRRRAQGSAEYGVYWWCCPASGECTAGCGAWSHTAPQCWGSDKRRRQTAR